MNPSSLILAFDIGTSSLRTALFDLHGRIIAKTLSHQAYSLHVDHDGTAELPVHDLEQAALRALRTTFLARTNNRALKNRPIFAVSGSCFWHSLLGYDAKRRQPTPIYTWGDARCHEVSVRLRAHLRESTYHARTGCMLRTSYWPAKLRWLTRTGLARGITNWMSPAEWIYGRLCGASSISISMASGTGLMNLRTNRWDEQLLHQLKIRDDLLGTISDEPLHPTTETPVLPPLHRFPELKDAAWFPALGDGAASNIGSDAISSSTAALNVGTSAALRLVAGDVPSRFASGLFCYRVDQRRCLLGGAISNAGNLRAWAIKELRLPDGPAAVERLLAKRMRPSPGLTVLPFWTGERAPSWPESVSGTITGIAYATTSLDLLQALTESTYHRLAQIADLLEAQNGHRLRIIVSGGIRRSPESLQRLANVLGRTLETTVEPEASLRGAALFALERLGLKVKPLPRGNSFHPNRTAAALYAKVRAAQILLEQKTTGSFSAHRHAKTRR